MNMMCAGISENLFIFFHEGNIEIHTVQSDSNTIGLFSFHFSLNIMRKCRTIELSDYRAVGQSIH